VEQKMNVVANALKEHAQASKRCVKTVDACVKEIAVIRHVERTMDVARNA
jgi:hypothetical protein